MMEHRKNYKKQNQTSFTNNYIIFVFISQYVFEVNKYQE